MFYTPKPRRFTYKPRFYDPEKERWDAMKQKYADTAKATSEPQTTAPAEGESDDLAYFERRVKQIDSKERKEKSKMKIGDLFRKRAMPTFHYQPRFEGQADKEGNAVDAEGQAIMQRMRKHKMSRRFDIEDEEYMKPVSAGKIMMYALIATLLLLWIFL